MTERERIGRRIAELRELRGISQIELAEMTGIKQPNLSRIESGKYSTNIDLIAKIATALNCRIEINQEWFGKGFVKNGSKNGSKK